MSVITIKLDKPELFEELVMNALPECADLQIVTKDHGTVEGNAIAVLSFTVGMPDGSRMFNHQQAV